MSLVAILALWELLGWSHLVYNEVIPPIESIVAALLGFLRSPLFWQNAAITASEVSVGLSIAFVAGVGLGLLFGIKRFLGDVADPFVTSIATSPKVIFFPIAILLFGAGPSSKIALGALAGIFPIVLTVAAALREIDPVHILVGRSFRLNAFEMVRRIYLPSLVWPIVNGLRLGLGLTIVAVLVGEIKLSDKGLGWMTIDAYNHFRLPQMYALLGAIFVVAVGANAVLGRIVQRHYRLS